MRLYTNKRGDWAGTQADARKLDGKYIEIDVPVSKADLLTFLNQNSVGSMAVQDKPEPTPAERPEVLSHDAAGWVSWAYERLRSGKKADAEAMLLKGLKIQREMTN
tara:strand:+ start:5912 stop:6229 length:318 start_codon:yes stop_codon:yes gene_type:complete